MLLILSALIVAGAVVWAALRIAGELARGRADAARGRTLDIMALMAPGLAASVADPRALLAWQPLATTARRVCPEEFAALDAAARARFPFSDDEVQAAHARWTSQWLAWEHAHDAEFKLKAAAAESELTASGGAPLMRARCDAVEREKIETYQRRYEEYIRVAKALQALQAPPS